MRTLLQQLSHRYPTLSVAVVALALTAGYLQSQTAKPALPNPYRAIENWAKLPAGRAWGSAAGISIDSRENLWVFERCAGNSCSGRGESPILQFDPSGKLMKQFGEGMFVFPHGIFVDRENNVWVTDADGKDGKGHQVVKFSPDGKVLFSLGKAGVAGAGPDTFNRPSGVVVAPNGAVFVADGHGGDSNARIVKFSKDGKFIKAWGKKGTAPGEFNGPHSITIDSKGRIFVADRENNRIQIFDQDGKFLEQWTQFGRPTGLFMDRHDVLYVTDNLAGIRIGSAKDGVVTAFIPDLEASSSNRTGAEGVVTDKNGNLYAAEVLRTMVKKYVPK